MWDMLLLLWSCIDLDPQKLLLCMPSADLSNHPCLPQDHLHLYDHALGTNAHFGPHLYFN